MTEAPIPDTPAAAQPAGRTMHAGEQPCREMQLATLPQAVDPPSGIWRALLARFIYPFRRGVVPEPRPATGFYTDTTVCIGCKACEVACKQWNQLPADGYQLSGKSYDNTVELSATSWRHVKFIEQFPIEDFRARRQFPRSMLLRTDRTPGKGRPSNRCRIAG